MCTDPKVGCFRLKVWLQKRWERVLFCSLQESSKDPNKPPMEMVGLLSEDEPHRDPMSEKQRLFWWLIRRKFWIVGIDQGQPWRWTLEKFRKQRELIPPCQRSCRRRKRDFANRSNCRGFLRNILDYRCNETDMLNEQDVSHLGYGPPKK